MSSDPYSDPRKEKDATGRRYLRNLMIVSALLFILTSALLLLFYLQGRNTVFSEKIGDFRLSVNLINNAFRESADIVVRADIMQPDVIEILKQAYDGDRDEARRKLHERMSRIYGRLAYRDIRQIHFILKNNESFLRMHRPELYGDDLTPYRYSHRIANERLIEVHGFEEGRVFSGYRNVYPIVYDGVHYGIVEISIGFDAFRSHLSREFHGEYAYISLKSNLMQKRLEGEMEKFTPSSLNDDFVWERGYVPSPLMDRLNEKIRPKLGHRLEEFRPFSIPADLNNRKYLVTFLPVHNVEGRNAAYFIEYMEDYSIYRLNVRFLSTLVYAFFTVLILSYLVWLGMKRKLRIIEQEEEYHQSLENNKQRIERLESGTGIGYWEYTFASGNCYFSPGFIRLSGSGTSECDPEAFTIQVHAEDRAILEKHRKQAVTDGTGYSMEFRMQADSKGGLRYLFEECRAIRSDTGVLTHVIGTLIDITERRLNEQRMTRQERLAAIGQLSAGIAHDFNNMLTGIIGANDLLMLSSDPDAECSKFINIISNSANKAASLTRQILDFSKKSIINQEALVVEQYVLKLLPFIQQTIGERIQLHFENTAPGSGLTIFHDHGQFEQALLNLVINARDAMEEGGDLSIILGERNIIENESDVCCLCDDIVQGEFVCIEVRDTGHGIPEHVLDHIFEPFYTTKGVEKGTGLGLAQVQGIVSQNNGHLSVRSRPGEGTSIILYYRPYLPEADISYEEKKTEPSRFQNMRCLLIEDENTVRTVEKSFLEMMGFEVTAVSTAVGGLKAFLENRDSLDLVITDMVLPDHKGTWLIDRIFSEIPDMKVVVISGYPLSSDEVRVPSYARIHWIQKPVSIHTLSRELREMFPGGK